MSDDRWLVDRRGNRPWLVYGRNIDDGYVLYPSDLLGGYDELIAAVEFRNAVAAIVECTRDLCADVCLVERVDFESGAFDQIAALLERQA